MKTSNVFKKLFCFLTVFVCLSVYSFAQYIDQTGSSYTGNIYHIGGNVGIGTASPGSLLDVRGSAVFNDNGDQNDFRIESDTKTNIFYVDGAGDKIGIGTNGPTVLFDVAGISQFRDVANLNGGVVCNDNSDAKDFRIESDGQTHILYVDGTNNRIGFNTSSPSVFFDVNGVAAFQNTTSVFGAFTCYDNAVFNENGNQKDFRIESDNSANMFFVKGVDDRIGINTNTPLAKLHVYASTKVPEFYSEFNMASIPNTTTFTPNAFGVNVGENAGYLSNLAINTVATGCTTNSVVYGLVVEVEHDELSTYGIESIATYMGDEDDGYVFGASVDAAVDNPAVEAYAIGVQGAANSTHVGFNLGVIGDAGEAEWSIAVAGNANGADVITDLETGFASGMSTGGLFYNDNTGSTDFAIYAKGGGQSYFENEVGINTLSPTEALDVDGSGRFRQILNGSTARNDLAYTTSGNVGTLVSSASDKRLKKDITPLSDVLSKVLQLQGVSFYWKDSPDAEKKDIGMIAQEVEKIFPEAVFTNPTDGFMGINYSRFPAILAEAIKEQQQMIEKQNEEIAVLKEKITSLNNLDGKIAALENCCNANSGKESPTGSSVIELNDRAYLEQNIPNPFSESTEVSYYLPKSVKAAAITIYDLKGKVIRNFEIAERGNGKVVIKAKELNPGVYFYSLFTDNTEVETKSMILTN